MFFLLSFLSSIDGDALCDLTTQENVFCCCIEWCVVSHTPVRSLIFCLSCLCVKHPQWAIKGPVTPLDGAKEGILSFLHEVLASISDVVRLPVRGARKNNVVGAIKGLSIGIICLAQRPIRGGILLVDKFLTGIVNFVLGQTQRIKHASPLAQTEIEMVHGPTAWRYTFYGGFSDWELAVKDRLFGNFPTHCFASNDQPELLLLLLLQ